MSIQQIVRDILERAIEDGLVDAAPEELREEPDPQHFTAGDLAGCTGLLAGWLRRRGAQGAAPEAGE
jgi:hypothetical protein